MLSKIISYALRLTILCVVTAFLLAFVYKKTKPKIEEQKKIIDNQVKIELMPFADKFEQVNENYFIAYDKDGKVIGKITKSAERGYCGNIRVMTSINNKKEIAGIKVVEHYETPGLGDEITKVYFISQFKNKTISEIKLRKDGGSINAITGATISSKACIGAVRKAFENIEKNGQRK